MVMNLQTNRLNRHSAGKKHLSSLVLSCVLSMALLSKAVAAKQSDYDGERPADMVVLNANIITLEAQNPKARAMAVVDGYIADIGSDNTIKQWIGDETEIINAEGLTVLPGFIDTHNHVFEGATDIGGGCELSASMTLSEQIPVLEECSENAGKKGQWVTGYGHQLNALMDEDIDDSPRAILDDIFPENPVVIMEESSHSMLVNSKALSMVGFNEQSADPQGGILMRDNKTGLLNGVLFDSAGDLVMELAWNSQNQLFEINYDGLKAGLEAVAANGITTVGDGRMYWQRGWFDVWKKAEKEDQLTARVSVRPWIYPDLPMDEQLDFLKGIQSDDIENLLIVNQVKMYIDGVIHFGTAKVAKKYDWTWQSEYSTGLYYITPESLVSWLPALNSIGYGAHIHAIGDLGISQSIDAIAKVRGSGSNQLYGLTHLEMVRKKDFVRFSRHGIDADFQAGAVFFTEHSWAVPYVGKLRANNMLQMRGVYDAGANVTFSSDWTVNDMNPLIAIANSLRLRKRHGLPDIDAALRAATINGAKSLGLANVTGSLKVGKSADFVILSADITKLPPNKIEQTEIYSTVLMGDFVFDLDD